MTERIRAGVSVPSDVPLELRSTDKSVVDAVDFEERIVRMIAMPYGERALVEHRGQVIEEEVEPGAFDGISALTSHVTANRDHDYTRTVGKAVDYPTGDTRGFVAEVHISETPLGDETLRLAADGVLRASVGMLVKRSDQTIIRGVRRIRRAFLDHIAFVPNPAYAGAEILSVRQFTSSPGQRAGEIRTPETPVSTPRLDAILGDPFYSALLGGQRHPET